MSQKTNEIQPRKNEPITVNSQIPALPESTQQKLKKWHINYSHFYECTMCVNCICSTLHCLMLDTLFSFASHSAYTEAYNVCSMAVGPQVSAVGEDVGKMMGEEDQGRTSEEEEGGTENNYDKQVGFLKRTQRF